MKLELKHLAPYIPYGIKIKKTHPIIVPEYCIEVLDSLLLHRMFSWGEDSTLNAKWVKPLLYPLSMLTEEIEHNGERFVPAIEIAKLVDNGHSHSASSVISSPGSNYIKIRTGAVDDVEDVQVSFRDGRIQSVERSGVKVMYQTVVRIQDRLASMHIDFQSLIPAGLAVDKREVKQG